MERWNDQFWIPSSFHWRPTHHFVIDNPVFHRCRFNVQPPRSEYGDECGQGENQSTGKQVIGDGDDLAGWTILRQRSKVVFSGKWGLLSVRRMAQS